MHADALYDFAHLGHGSVDAQGRIRHAHPSLQSLLGVPREAIEGHALADFIHPEDRARCAERLAQPSQPEPGQHAPSGCELRLLSGRTCARWVDLSMARWAATGGMATPAPQPHHFLLTDITARKQAEAALQTSENMLKEAQTTAQLGCFHWDAITQHVTWSDELFRIYGQLPGKFQPSLETYLGSVHPQDLPRVQQRLQGAIATRTDFAHDYRLLLPDGTQRWVHARGRPVLDSQGALTGLQGTCQDITARKQSEEALQSSLHDKEALLRELHHRVKNNLQLVSSLLRIENQRPVPRNARDVLDGMQGRIQSMALLHEYMYRPGVFVSVDLGSYLRELAHHAFQTQVVRPDGIRLLLELDTLQLSMDQAMPCGLLVNELLCNSLKHAFPGQDTGEVRVSLRPHTGAGQWCLEVSDTGVGLPADVQLRQQSSLGLRLVADLADQIGGPLAIRQSGTGASFSVVFEPVASSPAPTPA